MALDLLCAENPAPFAMGSVAAAMLRKGWSYPETHHTWNDGREAYMDVPIIAKQPTVFDFALFPFRPTGCDAQVVHIFTNEHRIAIWKVTEAGQFSFVLPPPERNESSVLLEWRFPDAVSPAAAGLHADPRLLAVALQSVRMHAL